MFLNVCNGSIADMIDCPENEGFSCDRKKYNLPLFSQQENSTKNSNSGCWLDFRFFDGKAGLECLSVKCGSQKAMAGRYSICSATHYWRQTSSRSAYEDLASGCKDDRPGLTACLKALQPGNTLVVWKLDRLGRDLKHLVNTVDDLSQRGVGLKVLAGAQIDTTTANCNGSTTRTPLLANSAPFLLKLTDNKMVVWSKNSSALRYQHLSIYCRCHNIFLSCLKWELQFMDDYN